MIQNSFGVHVPYVSVERSDGSDPRAAAREVLTTLRVLAAVRDATAAWNDHDEAVLMIPVTDGGAVLTLTDEDTIATTLAIDALREAFGDAELHLSFGDEDDAVDVGPETIVNVDDVSDVEPEAIEPVAFEPEPVHVAAFSHRGPGVARILAEANRTAVVHTESGDWSLQLFESEEPTAGWVSAKAELPVIEVNRVDGGEDWIEVTSASGTVSFWPNAERDTRPVLDPDMITVSETAEVYRRLLIEGDGSRDELAEIAASVPLDVDTAHRALISESLGGVVGSDERRRVLLAAFGIPDELIARAFDGESAPVKRFEPVGWASAVWNMLLAGLGELAPITRRETPWQRLTAAVRRRPWLGMSLSAAELVFGVWATGRFRGAARSIGVLAIVDACVDIVVWVARLRRR